ncbi:MAG: O-antigen ligase family protein, partial [Rhodospirillaceae bacterium]
MQIRLFVYAGTVYAIYGLIEYFSGNHNLLFFERWAYRNDLTSVFVNRNNYATYSGLVLLSAAALIFKNLNELNTKSIRDFFSLPKNHAFHLYITFCALLCNLTALFLTHSRGGFISLSVSMLLLLTITIKKDPGKRFKGFAVLLLVMVVIFTLFLSGDVTLTRLFQTSIETSLRDDLYFATLEGIKGSPISGWGYGNFEDNFKAFYSPLLAKLNWDKAHNSYLEIIFELG